ncbi:hypothetical protein EVAR_3977_1 [Eumeta japonica]|uniref:Uncharacterized protein n=1 Tax=Eumeta variegata TaxID=151549 RepID=A0A4C1SR67_EUMVA|nr:hypothetical protein EVAR_3977_1 [Eumeta japonica]
MTLTALDRIVRSPDRRAGRKPKRIQWDTATASSLFPVILIFLFNFPPQLAVRGGCARPSPFSRGAARPSGEGLFET